MSNPIRRLTSLITTHSKTTMLVVLVLTVGFAAGIPMVEQDSDTQQFETDSPAANASEYIDENFVVNESENETTVQIIQRPADGNALSRASLLETLAYQQAIRNSETINQTLVNGTPTNGVANILGTVALGQLLDPGDIEDPARLSNLSDEEVRGLATMLGYRNDTEQAVVIQTISGLAALDGGNQTGESPDPAEMNESQRRDFAAVLGISGEDNVSTFLDLADTLAPPESMSLASFQSLDSSERDAVTAFLDVEELPPQHCVDAFSTQDGATPQPPLDCYSWTLNQLTDSEFETLVTSVLGENGNDGVFSFLPGDYERGSTTANASAIYVTQKTDAPPQTGSPGGSPAVTAAQLEMRSLSDQQPSDYAIFGFGIISEEINQSLGDSFAIVGPIALLFVILALVIAYRDLFDILLGIFGIIAVLIWTFGFMGWAGISFNQLLISVPVLLIGLSIDYAIHVFMRHRERRAEDDVEGIDLSMAIALGGVGVALIWVTATAAIGFLANLTSPIGPLQDFGIVSAFGVIAALIIFGALVPATKIEVDSWLENRGFDRAKAAFGTGESRFSTILSGGAYAAKRFPLVVIVLTLLLTVGGAYGAMQVDTQFDQEDFLAESPPGWTEHLPGPMQPGEYRASEDLRFVQENFQPENSQGDLLIRGNVTDEQTLRWLETAADDLADRKSTFVISGDPDVTTPLSVMRDTAAANEDTEFAVLFRQSTGTDGVPEENVTALFQALVRENPDARQLVALEGDGSVRALRIQIGLQGDAETAQITEDLRGAATAMETNSGGNLEVIATSNAIIFSEVESDLLATVIQGLIITLVAVFVFLMIAYRLTGNPASLGLVTLLPVLLAVTWILGSMWLLDISFNTLTGTITSLTIGLGIAYSIHISSRYELELRKQGDVWKALDTTVTGTGGALLGSAATTVGGFGTLAFAILPVLQQFGIITGLTIIYAFLASVFVLPALLVMWTRYLGPAEYFPEPDSSAGESE